MPAPTSSAPTSSAPAASTKKAEIAREEDAHVPRRSRSRWRPWLIALVVIGFFVASPAAHHVRAASLLMTFDDPNAKPAVVEELLSIDVPGSAAAPARTVRARMFSPPGGSPTELPVVVLVHGVQYLGIEEPRLLRFARSIVSAGLIVVTPQVDELADYHVSPRSIDTVGATALAMRARAGGAARVGLMGTSFGGGIALLAAADPRFASEIAFVVAIGAYDDLARVSRFFATDEVEEVTGATKKLHAHGYGATVLAYTHVEDFFPAADVPAARAALRSWLREDRDAARESAKALSPAAKAKMDIMFGPDISALRPELLSMIERRTADMSTVSPHANLGGLRANVYLLHGAGDTVVPATETMWLAKDVPASTLRAVLVSSAIEHVELKAPTIADRLALVHFMGAVIGEAEASR